MEVSIDSEVISALSGQGKGKKGSEDRAKKFGRCFSVHLSGKGDEKSLKVRKKRPYRLVPRPLVKLARRCFWRLPDDSKRLSKEDVQNIARIVLGCVPNNASDDATEMGEALRKELNHKDSEHILDRSVWNTGEEEFGLDPAIIPEGHVIIKKAVEGYNLIGRSAQRSAGVYTQEEIGEKLLSLDKDIRPIRSKAELTQALERSLCWKGGVQALPEAPIPDGHCVVLVGDNGTDRTYTVLRCDGETTFDTIEGAKGDVNKEDITVITTKQDLLDKIEECKPNKGQGVVAAAGTWLDRSLWQEGGGAFGFSEVIIPEGYVIIDKHEGDYYLISGSARLGPFAENSEEIKNALEGGDFPKTAICSKAELQRVLDQSLCWELGAEGVPDSKDIPEGHCVVVRNEDGGYKLYLSDKIKDFKDIIALKEFTVGQSLFEVKSAADLRNRNLVISLSFDDENTGAPNFNGCPVGTTVLVKDKRADHYTLLEIQDEGVARTRFENLEQVIGYIDGNGGEAVDTSKWCRSAGELWLKSICLPMSDYRERDIPDGSCIVVSALQGRATVLTKSSMDRDLSPREVLGCLEDKQLTPMGKSAASRAEEMCWPEHSPVTIIPAGCCVIQKGENDKEFKLCTSDPNGQIVDPLYRSAEKLFNEIAMYNLTIATSPKGIAVLMGKAARKQYIDGLPCLRLKTEDLIRLLSVLSPGFCSVEVYRGSQGQPRPVYYSRDSDNRVTAKAIMEDDLGFYSDFR